jgi:hypothetical protein
MQIRIIDGLGSIRAMDWDALDPAGNPFLRHAFLYTLEQTGCVGQHTGWIPQHVVITEEDRLVGAMPMYLKDHSFGEFVFDWAWANAYQRCGLPYYPKLVVAVPFTPVTGPRLLIEPGADRARIGQLLATAALERARELGASSVHWLFTNSQDTRQLLSRERLQRAGYQFHWENPGCSDFDGFLATLSAKKRKNIKRERRRVREAGITVDVLDAHQVNPETWRRFHDYYAATSWRKGGTAYLNVNFITAIARAMPDQTLLSAATHQGELVAGALCFRDATTLYGRNWGTLDTFDSLHFETCYYTPLDYCIRQGLQRFEAGAQGEHKISRGFLPAPVHSVHWIADQEFRSAIERFLNEEQRYIGDYMDELDQHSPYRVNDDNETTG